MAPTSRHRNRQNFLQANWHPLSSRRTIRSGSFDAGRHSASRLDRQSQRIETVSPLETVGIPAWKRISDIFLILLTLPLVAVLMAAIACWIKLASPGRVLFRQTRIGRGGKAFTLYKFRTMECNASTSIHEAHVEQLIKSDQPMTKLDFFGDKRLIKGVSLVRMSGLDELPQLINVLRGEMSLVGPRPCIPSEFPLFEKKHQGRFALQPGLTGLWQVARTESTTFREMAEMDVEYAERLSPWTDLTIVSKTPVAVIRQIRTYVQAGRRSYSKGRKTQSAHSASPTTLLHHH